jgi:thioredoxin 1
MRPKYIERLTQGLAIGAAALALNGCEDKTEVPLVRDGIGKCMKEVTEGVRKDLTERLEGFSRRKDDLETFAYLVNALRAKKNVPPLSYGECAQKMAEYWAKNPKAPAGGHEADGETPTTRMEEFGCASAVLENVSWPDSFDGAHIFQQWNAIPGDRVNMKSSRITEMGLHCVKGTDVKSGRFCTWVGTAPENAQKRKLGVLNLNADDFQHEVLDVGDKPALVEFYTSWCGVCKDQEPILQQVAREMGDRAVIAKVMVDEDHGNYRLKKKYGAKSFPTLTIFKNGRVHCSREGLRQRSYLRRLLKNHMSK